MWYDNKIKLENTNSNKKLTWQDYRSYKMIITHYAKILISPLIYYKL